MSIDFATLQGLTIPEGVVTQIEDAAGRVLWSAAVQELISGTMYLRPSADVSCNHYVNSGSVGYSKINEEVADDDSTYIAAYDESKAGVVTSVFAMDFDDAITPKSITSAKLVVRSKCNDSITMDGEEMSTIYTLSFGGVFSHSATKVEYNSSYATVEYDLNSVCADLNNYLSANGHLPAITLTIDSEYPKSVVKSGYSLYITQVYLELDGEFIR